MQLLSFSVPLNPSQFYGSSIAPVLQQLPASTLTQLQCSIDWSSSADLAALGRLTALRRLHVTNDRTMPYDALVPLCSLQQLTHLQLQSVQPAHLQELPPWLQQLHVAHINPTVAHGDSAQQQQRRFQLQLGHLTGLTSLRVGARPSYLRYDSARHLVSDCDVMTAASQLPPNLQELSWPDCSNIEPLLCLQQLQRLQLHRIEQKQLDAFQLLQLCNVSSLTELQLGYGKAECITASAAAAWQQLPSLRVLSLYCTNGDGSRSVLAEVIQQLGSLQRLARLEIVNQHKYKLPSLVQVAPAQLGAALLPLTALQQLRIEGIHLILPPLKKNQSFTWCQPPEGVMQLLDAVGVLVPGLQKLRMDLRMNILKEDAEHIVSQQQRLQRQLGVFSVEIDALVLAKGCREGWDE
jgi:hypothetical protein